MEKTNADAGTNVSSGDSGHAVDKIKAEPHFETYIQIYCVYIYIYM
jgi:hypothetical protein